MSLNVLTYTEQEMNIYLPSVSYCSSLALIVVLSVVTTTVYIIYV